MILPHIEIGSQVRFLKFTDQKTSSCLLSHNVSSAPKLQSIVPSYSWARISPAKHEDQNFVTEVNIRILGSPIVKGSQQKKTDFIEFN